MQDGMPRFLQRPGRGARQRQRAAVARRWARFVMVLLGATVLVAIWQDERLSPPLHAQMERAVMALTQMPASSEEIRAHLARLSRSAGGGDGSPVVGWLMKLNQ
jgi:hypothetical protein